MMANTKQTLSDLWNGFWFFRINVVIATVGLFYLFTR